MGDDNDKSILGNAGGGDKTTDGNTNNGDPNAKPDANANAVADGGMKDGQNNDANKPKGAPEKYEAFKLPDGITINAEVEKEFVALAKELNIPQDKAQALIDIQVKASKRVDEESKQVFENLKKEWTEKTLKDLGSEKDKSLAYAAKFLDKVGDKDLRKFLDESGLGNHPSLVKAFIEAGKLMAEDSFVEGKPTYEGKTYAEILYPKHSQT